MFTGIVQGAARVAALERRPQHAKLRLALPPGAAPDRLGDSVAVNGVCLTIEHLEDGEARFHLLTETLSVTNLGDLVSGAMVNIERALRAGDPLGGHWVLGHVDTTAEVLDLRPLAGQTELVIRVPEAVAPYVVPKGSMAVDGVSLTIARIDGDAVTFALIPETLRLTALGGRKRGERVNVEADYLAKLITAQILRMKEGGRFP